ncbi:MAG TPA: M28 family peptidase [Longimicrobiales bacterium]|nr:M28 family peptidase [Longimicrobiales bacterium]
MSWFADRPILRRAALRVACATLPALLALTALDPLQTALQSVRAHQLRAHLWLLSHDRMEGRAPGTRGGELAALYIASQFTRGGVEPLDGSYIQQVPLLAMTPLPARSAATFTRESQVVALDYGTQFFAWAENGDSLARAEGELVFAGYGVTAPEYDWDDYGGRDLRGKIVMVLVNDPPAPPEEPLLFDGRAMTYYGRWTYKIEEARRRGAAGVVIIHETVAAGYPWSVVQTSWSAERLSLARAADERDSVAVGAWVTRAAADSLLRLAGLDLDGLTARAARRSFVPVATGIRASLSAPGRARRFDAVNVWAVVRGSDPVLREQAVVYTAHYDHLGIAEPVDGDSIYNGAYDNASGVAALIEIAEGFSLMHPRPARSVVFLATTGEEMGLLGAEYYVRNPAVPLALTAAVINLDGVNVWGETDDIIVLGGERSTIGPFLQRRANDMNLRITGDRSPERGFYFRSDQFPFARAGVPAVKVEHGTHFRDRPAEWGERVLRRYEGERYHQPADEFSPEFDLAGAVQQARFALSVGYDIAQADSMPDWYVGSEFQRPP